MFKFRKTLGDRMILFGARGNIVSEVDGIALVDCRKKGPLFRQTMERSLALIHDYDDLHYRKVLKHIRWIVNHVSSEEMGMEYNPRIKCCIMEFADIPGTDSDGLAAIYACLLVHIATQGTILSRMGVHRNTQFWNRVACISLKEGRRFALKLTAIDPVRYRADILLCDSDYPCWSMLEGPKRGLVAITRLWKDRRAEPKAPPNGGPSSHSGNSEVAEGPPSVN